MKVKLSYKAPSTPLRVAFDSHPHRRAGRPELGESAEHRVCEGPRSGFRVTKLAEVDGLVDEVSGGGEVR